MKFIKKPYVYAVTFGCLLTGGFGYSMLKTFVLSEAITTVATTETTTSDEVTESEGNNAAATAVQTDTSYSDENIQVSIETITTNNTTVYVADVRSAHQNT